MVFYVAKRLQFCVIICVLALGLNTSKFGLGFAFNFPHEESPRLKERIEFAVKWSFIPLLHTHMEIYRLGSDKAPVFYRLTHQAAGNSFWNDRMVSTINSESLLPCQTETIIKDGKDGQKHWKESITFDRHLGKARYSRQNGEDGEIIVNSIDITGTSMDPLSAFYYLRKRLSPSNSYLELGGITGSRRFTMRGKLVAEQRIDVPAGTFETYRLECTLEYWKQSQTTSKRNSNPFTLWVTRDHHRFPVQIRYHLLLGSLWVKAMSVQYYGVVS